MRDWIVSLHSAMRGMHVGLGCLGLLMFWVVVALPKGTHIHRACGRVFLLLAYVVGGTALVSSCWALLHVDSFAPSIARQEFVPQTELREQYRFLFAILLYLSVGTLAAASYGVAAMRNKAEYARLRSSPAFFWQLACIASGLGLVVFAGVRLALGRPESTSFSAAMYVIPLLLGMLGVLGGLKELQSILRPPASPRAWLYKHVEQMFGAGIAFHTAFIVFGVNRLIGFQWPAGWALLPWIGPPVLGLALTKWYVARLKMQTGEFSERFG